MYPSQNCMPKRIVTDDDTEAKQRSGGFTSGHVRGCQAEVLPFHVSTLSIAIPAKGREPSNIILTSLSPWPPQQTAHAAQQRANCAHPNTHTPTPSRDHSAALAAPSPTPTRKMLLLHPLQQQATSTKPSTHASAAKTKPPTRASAPRTAKRWKK
jgi:hypothetical protein